MKKLLSTLIVLFIGLVVGAGIGFYGNTKLDFFSSSVKTSDTKVVQSIKTSEEVALLQLGIQGITGGKGSNKIGDWEIPGTDRALFIKYNYRAKLGIDGSMVNVEKTGERKYKIYIPAFKFIGIDEPTYETAVETNGVLSFATPQADKVELISKIVNETEKQKHIADNKDLLKKQTIIFYEHIVKAVDNEAQLEFVFAS